MLPDAIKTTTWDNMRQISLHTKSNTSHKSVTYHSNSSEFNARIYVQVMRKKKQNTGMRCFFRSCLPLLRLDIGLDYLATIHRLKWRIFDTISKLMQTVFWPWCGASYAKCLLYRDITVLLRYSDNTDYEHFLQTNWFNCIRITRQIFTA